MAYKAGTLGVDILGVSNDAVASIDATTRALRRLARATDLVSKSNLSGVLGVVGGSSSSGKGTKNVGGSSRSRNYRGGLFRFASWYTLIYLGRMFGRVIGNIAQAGSDYTETLNLWETAMGRNVELAEKFVDKMNTAYGISEKTLMNAQAIFKNMLGSLGQISDETAYRLSEGVTQMALDYASLYNQTFAKAFEKFQSALAGQVRPIRSIAGYDITENTLYQMYQQLGGTKSVRNLSRTEKQLLSLLSIFHQMERSGALGDLDKTMESYANQSRILAESWEQAKTYIGIIFTYFIQNSKIITNLAAALMVVSDVIKSYAESVNAIQHFANDPFASTEESANSASEAVDKLSGKLLDFDKFRALSSSDEENISLDQMLLEALAGYNSILANASNTARELADTWLNILGFVDKNNDGIFEMGDKLKEIVGGFKSFASIWGGFASRITTALQPLIESIKKELPIIIESLGRLLDQIIPLIVTILERAISMGNDWIPFIEDVITVLLNDILPVVVNIVEHILTLFNTSLFTSQNGIKSIIEVLRIAITFIGHLLSILDALEPLFNFIEKASTVVSAIASVFVYLGSGLFTVVVAALELMLKIVSTIFEVIRSILSFDFSDLGSRLKDLWSNWQVGSYASSVSMPKFDLFANGGLPDKGTVFIAGEAGAEIVYNTPSGQSGVANVQQIAQATRVGVYQALNEWWGGGQARRDIPQLEEASSVGIYQAAKKEMLRRGEW